MPVSRFQRIRARERYRNNAALTAGRSWPATHKPVRQLGPARRPTGPRPSRRPSDGGRRTSPFALNALPMPVSTLSCTGRQIYVVPLMRGSCHAGVRVTLAMVSF